MTNTLKAVLREWMWRRVRSHDDIQAEVVKRSGVKAGNFSSMLSGKRSPSIDYFERIVKGEEIPLHKALQELAEIAHEQQIKGEISSRA